MERHTVKALQEHLRKSVEGFAADNKLAIRLVKNNANFGVSDAKFSIEVEDTSSTAVADSFASYAGLFGLEASDKGAEFKSQGTLYKVARILPNRPKFPIVGTRVSDNKEFLFTADGVKRALEERRKFAVVAAVPLTVVKATIPDNQVTVAPPFGAVDASIPNNQGKSVNAPGAGDW